MLHTTHNHKLLRAHGRGIKNTVSTKNFSIQKLLSALALRKDLKLMQNSTGICLIHRESYGLPGLVVDQYDDALVMQIGSAGAEH